MNLARWSVSLIVILGLVAATVAAALGILRANLGSAAHGLLLW